MIDRVRWAERELGYKFSDPSLLEQALTHRSASKLNNERMEFLGDAMLNFTVAKDLFKARPKDSEGDLSRARAALVKKGTLAAIGQSINVDSQLILGAGELRSGGAQRSSALADSVEALIGAVLIDGGYAPAKQLIKLLLREHFEALPAADALKDAKTELQEWLQARGHSVPDYSVESTTGKDHAQTFRVICRVDELEKQAMGTGSSRRRAEQDAAAAMLSKLNGGTD